MRSRPATLTVLILLLGAGACTSDDGETPAAPGSALPSPTAASSPTASPAAGTAPQAEAPAPTEVDPGETVYFTSPTGNIVCSLGGANAVCEIAEHAFTPPPKPADCDLDHGTMIGLEGAGPAEFLCHGDTAFGFESPVLAYGDRIGNGLVSCASEESGMSCTGADRSHGFELSRASYRVY